MNDRPRIPLGTISILLGAIPVLALVSWFLFYTPCGHPRRLVIEGAMFWGSLVAIPFGIYAAVKERPRKRAMIGLVLGLTPLVCVLLLIVAIVLSIATGGRGVPGVLDLSMAGDPTNFEAGVFAATETTYYDIAGSTLPELEAQAATLGPHGYFAEAVPFFRWNYTYREENGTCRIDRVRVDTKVIITYPRWNGSAAAPEVIDGWGRRMARLEQHEGEHERISRTTGQEIHATLAGLPTFPTCGDLEKEIEARAQALIAQDRAANEEFDRATDHGNRLAGALP